MDPGPKKAREIKIKIQIYKHKYKMRRVYKLPLRKEP